VCLGNNPPVTSHLPLLHLHPYTLAWRAAWTFKHRIEGICTQTIMLDLHTISIPDGTDPAMLAERMKLWFFSLHEFQHTELSLPHSHPSVFTLSAAKTFLVSQILSAPACFPSLSCNVPIPRISTPSRSSISQTASICAPVSIHSSLKHTRPLSAISLEPRPDTTLLTLPAPSYPSSIDLSVSPNP
jgi:hypothetical protein